MLYHIKWANILNALFCCGYIVGLVQDCSNSSANALKLLLSYTKPSISSAAMGPYDTYIHGPLTRCVKLRVAHAPGMPGKFSPAAEFKGNR